MPGVWRESGHHRLIREKRQGTRRNRLVRILHPGVFDHKRARLQRKGRSIVERPPPRADVDARSTIGAWNWWRDEYSCIPRYVYQDGTVAITMLIARVPYQYLGGQWAGPIPEPVEPKD